MYLFPQVHTYFDALFGSEGELRPLLSMSVFSGVFIGVLISFLASAVAPKLRIWVHDSSGHTRHENNHGNLVRSYRGVGKLSI